MSRPSIALVLAAVVLAALVVVLGCSKKEAAPPPAPDAAIAKAPEGDGGARKGRRKGGKGSKAAKVVDAGAPAPMATPEPASHMARFESVAEMRRHNLFEPFAEFVENEDDLEESTSDAKGDDEDDADASPDRPPSDLVLTRLALPGEVYDLSFEENCGEGLEDKRNLQHVILERRNDELREISRHRLCSEARRGLSIDVVKLTPKGPELVVRTWRLDDLGGEHVTRAFAVGEGGLSLLGEAVDDSEMATRFDVAFPMKKGTARIEIGIGTAEDEGRAREVRRYKLEPLGLVREGAPSASP